jgi:D-serine deaminase-like pyridoxal phosphate-dependent protein
VSDAIPHLDAISDLDTPSLLIDLDTLEDNITEMQEAVRASGVALRPHAKTHKCPDIARMQLEAGARGITVAKLGEAEVMVDAGIDDVLIAYPIVGEQKLSRLRELAARAQIAVTTDSVEVAEGLGRVGKDLGREMPVLVEVDTGLHRLGRPPGASTVALVQELSELPGVEIVGLLTHAGHAYRSSSREELQAVAEREGRDLVETAERCAEVGIPLRRISVGSTPTARIVAGVPGVTEIRPERFVLDAGTKAFTSDGADGPPFPGRGVVAGRPELRLDFMNEEHAVGRRTGRDDVRIGERLEVIPLHACATVNMFDRAFGVRDGEVVRTFDIAARGKLR